MYIMQGINYKGLKKRDSYDEIVSYIKTDKTKIKYPNRVASQIENSHYMKQLGGESLIDMEDQQSNVAKEQVKTTVIRQTAGRIGALVQRRVEEVLRHSLRGQVQVRIASSLGILVPTLVRRPWLT